MKKTLIILAILTIAMTSGFGQTANATATTSATVNSVASIAIDVNIDFGAILGDGVSPTIDPTSAVSHSDLLGTPTIGEFTVTGYNGASVLVSLTAATTTLYNSTTTDYMLFTPSLSEHVTTQGSATSLADGGSISMTATTHKIWVGGVLEANPGGGNITGIGAGTYTSALGAGDIELNVVYN